jgi:hypothetical protein
MEENLDSNIFAVEGIGANHNETYETYSGSKIWSGLE